MTEEAVAQKYGDQGLQNVRNALGDRAGYVTQFAFVELAPFHRSKSLTDLVNALAPANMQQNQRLPQGDFKALVTAMAEPADPMSAEQMIELVWDLAALTKAEIARLVLSLIANDVRPKRAHKIIHGMRSGGGTAANLKTMIDGLRGTLTKKETADVISELLAVGGQSIYQTYADLCQGEVGGLSAANYRAVIRLLRNPPEHTNALSEQQTVTFIHALQSKGCTGKQIHEIATSLIPGLTPTQANTLVTRYLVSLEGADLHDLITRTHGNRGGAVIKPKWLLDASDERYNNRRFPEYLQLGIGHKIKRRNDAQQLVDATVSIERMRNLTALMQQYGLPPKFAPELLALLPKLSGNTPDKRIATFMENTEGDWQNDVMVYLRKFVGAGRSPHGADNKKFTDTNFGGNAADRRNIGDKTITLHEGALNYICNAHTYSHCDFEDRTHPVKMRNVDSITFWPKEKTKNQILTDYRNIPDNILNGLANTVSSKWEQSGERSYAKATHNGLEIGLAYNGNNHREFFVDHLLPTGGESVPKAVLKTIWYLFDPPPPA